MRPALFAALILAAAPAGAQEPLFRSGEPLRYPLGAAPGPGKLVVADLSGDSRDDLAVLAAEVVVFITGAPAPEPDLARTGYPIATPSPLFLAADLDGDALPDLIAGGAAAVQVLRNTGGGSFAGAPSAPVGATPRAGKLVDLDEDGFLDLVVIEQPDRPAAASLGILLGDTKGGFLPEAARTLGEDVVGDFFAAEDFGGDGLLDVAFAMDGAEPRIRVLPGSGGAAFGEPIDTPIAFAPRLLASNYVDNDDLPDLVVLGGPPAEASQVLYLENTGTDEFAPDPAGEDGPPPLIVRELLSLLDFDEDGIVDVVTQFERHGLYGLRVRSGDGTGDFPRSADRFLARPALDFALLDVTGEGIRDLAAVESGDLAIYLGLDPGRLDIPGREPLDASPLGVAALDWSGDGSLDLAAHGSGTFYLLRGDGTGDFEPALRRDESGTLTHMAVGDFGGDPGLEPALVDSERSLIAILAVEPGGTVASSKDVPIAGTISGIAAADFDGDPGSELIVADSSSGQATMILDLAGDPRTAPIEAGAPQTAVDTGDVDGDGAQDIVLARQTGLRILLGDGAGAFLRTRDLPFLANARAVHVERGDAGSPRGIAGVAADGSSLVWIADPLGAPEPIDIADGSEFLSARALDIDGDSIPDLLATARQPSSAVQARLGRIGGGFASPETYAVGLEPGAFDVADLNADGLIDVVTADAASRTLSVLEGHLGQSTIPATFRRGDADADGSAAITDAIVILNWLFQGGPEPGCQDAADSDDSGVIDLTDAVRVLDFLFRGGPEPPEPGSAQCGEDPTADELGTCAAGCS